MINEEECDFFLHMGKGLSASVHGYFRVTSTQPLMRSMEVRCCVYVFQFANSGIKNSEANQSTLATTSAVKIPPDSKPGSL